MSSPNLFPEDFDARYLEAPRADTMEELELLLNDLQDPRYQEVTNSVALEYREKAECGLSIQVASSLERGDFENNDKHRAMILAHIYASGEGYWLSTSTNIGYKDRDIDLSEPAFRAVLADMHDPRLSAWAESTWEVLLANSQNLQTDVDELIDAFPGSKSRISRSSIERTYVNGTTIQVEPSVESVRSDDGSLTLRTSSMNIVANTRDGKEYRYSS
ncbi:MAG TPA: hypothetical protein VIJ25_07125, partial [Methylococcales bacterium]